MKHQNNLKIIFAHSRYYTVRVITECFNLQLENEIVILMSNEVLLEFN